MEIANHLTGAHRAVAAVRQATQADASAITHLLQTAPYVHLHADWQAPVEWLGTPGFVVKPSPSLPSTRLSWTVDLFGPRLRLEACLAVAAAPPPAAWVRVVSIAQIDAPDAVLVKMLDQVTDYLRDTGVTALGWLLMDEWPLAWLPDLGFVHANDIETYIKNDKHVPPVKALPELRIRPARLEDMARLAAIEAAAFEPLWQHDAPGLARARRHALSFDVALVRDAIVGFQLSTYTDRGAHLSRMTIHPAWQRTGIGSAILAHTLAGYHQQGIRKVTLNTQVDNIASQHLYLNFGFQATRQRSPVWVKPI